MGCVRVHRRCEQLPCPAPRSRPLLTATPLRHRVHTGTRSKCQAELAQLDRAIGKKEKELEGVGRQLGQAKARAAELAAELATKDRRLKALYEKQGRGGQVRLVGCGCCSRGRVAQGAWGACRCMVHVFAACAGPAPTHHAAPCLPALPLRLRSSTPRRSGTSGAARRWRSCRAPWPRRQRTSAARSSSWRRRRPRWRRYAAVWVCQKGSTRRPGSRATRPTPAAPPLPNRPLPACSPSFMPGGGAGGGGAQHAGGARGERQALAGAAGGAGGAAQPAAEPAARAVPARGRPGHVSLGLRLPGHAAAWRGAGRVGGHDGWMGSTGWCGPAHPQPAARLPPRRAPPLPPRPAASARVWTRTCGHGSVCWRGWVVTCLAASTRSSASRRS